MKGTLRKKNDKWVVEYKKIASYESQGCDFPDYEINELPLHSDDIKFYTEGLTIGLKDNTEVEFEIVELPLPENWEKNYIKYNITHDFTKVAKLISKQEELPNDEYLLKAFEDSEQELSKVTRLEVIDHTPQGEGRAYIQRGIKELELSYQDDGKTLKIFIK